MVPLAQNPQTNLKKKIFILNYKRHESLRGLNSSLAQSAAELWLAKVCPERPKYVFSEKFWIRPKTGFLTHNFGNRYASKSIQGSIDADFDLVFNKTFSQKSGSMGWGPGLAKISKTCLLCDVTSRNPPTENEIRFFSILITRPAKSADGLDSSLAQSPGELSDCKALQDLGLSRDWKGFNK